jgi:phosphatidylglycerol---prolipoprotein diacylglyceryl transferase
MRPVLWRWRGIKVLSFPFLVYLGLVLGIAAQNYVANAAGLPAGRIFAATLVLLIPALAGARLLFVAAYWEFYRRDPRRIWRCSEGGASLFGGLPLTLLVSIPLLRWLQVPIGSFWDVTSFTLLIGVMAGRFGCLLHGCCGGRRGIPTQLLEVAWALVVLAAEVICWSRMPFPGALFLTGLGAYGAGRFVLDFTRECSGGTLDRLTPPLVSILSWTVALVAWRA